MFLLASLRENHTANLFFIFLWEMDFIEMENYQNSDSCILCSAGVLFTPASEGRKSSNRDDFDKP